MYIHMQFEVLYTKYIILGNSKTYSMVQVFDYIQRKKDKKKGKIGISRKLTSCPSAH